MQSRFDYLDLAKGIGILLVVWAHILITGWSHQIIYAFHMPLFFFISGMLFNKAKYSSFRQFITARAKRLLVPYLIYSIASWALWAGFRFLRGDEVESFWLPLLQIIIAKGSGEFIVYNSALWFIPCLFAVEIIYYLFSRAKNQWITLALCFVMATVGYILAHIFGAKYLFLLPWNLDAAFYALPFYGIANTIMHYTSHSQLMDYCKKNRYKVLIAVGVLTAILINMALSYGECSMGSSSYNCNEWIFFERALCGCLALMLFCLWLSSFDVTSNYTKWLKWCGTNSLDIMSLHIPIKGVVIIVVGKLLAQSIDVSQSPLYSGISFIITLLVMIPIIILINKYIRKTTTKTNG